MDEDNIQSLGLLDAKLEMLANMRADNVPAAKLAAALDRLEEQHAILLGVLAAQQSGQDPGVGDLTQAWVERKIDEVAAEIAALHAYVLAHAPVIERSPWTRPEHCPNCRAPLPPNADRCTNCLLRLRVQKT